jgi:predicted pyridoxine 5'-phosphate oxidase superfamily flavin-nucleotide-binding protein
MATRGVFHEGELALQQHTGEQRIAERNGAIVAGAVMSQAQPFLAEQRTLAVASYDDEGRPWASLWIDRPGFVHSTPAGDVVHIDLSRASVAEDAVATLCSEGRELGLLAIDLETRRRLRINGRIATRKAQQLSMVVREAFPNCPKYIQRRQLHGHGAASASRESLRGQELDAARIAFVRQADTAFVASRHPERGVDASHRGGEPGFVHVEDTRTLRFPDYEGNGMYMTLGNLLSYPRAGVVFVDFERSRLLSITGRTELAHDRDEPAHPTGGTRRYWSLHVDAWREHALPAALHWELLDRSRFNPPATGA